MKASSIALAGGAIVVLAVGFAAYAPDRVASVAPAAGPVARQLHDFAFAAGGGVEKAPAAAATAQTILVSAATVKRADVPEIIDGLGQIQAYNTVTVRTRVDGQIVKIGFEEGHDVKAGDLIAQIDPNALQAALDQATAKKAQDEATLANARRDLERYAKLYKQDSGSQQQYDTQKALVDQLVATVASDAAAIEAARVQLAYAKIVAPISGRVGLRLVDQGNMVSSTNQTAIVTIAQLQPIAAIFSAPQSDLARVRAAMRDGAPKVEVKTAEGAALAVGKLTVIDNQVDPTTGTFKLKAEFANADHALWPGLAVSTETTVRVDHEALVVPAVALQRGPDGMYVYVVDGQSRAEVRNVKVARQTVDEAVIADGLAGGERVITTGAYLLQPGTPVRVSAAGAGS